LEDLLTRPEIKYKELADIKFAGCDTVDLIVAEQVEIQLKYAGYIERQQAEIERQKLQAQTILPESLDYNQVKGLSAEVCEKLQRIKPQNIAEAKRIPGVTPAAISILLVFLKKRAYQYEST